MAGFYSDSHVWYSYINDVVCSIRKSIAVRNVYAYVYALYSWSGACGISV